MQQSSRYTRALVTTAVGVTALLTLSGLAMAAAGGSGAGHTVAGQVTRTEDTKATVGDTVEIATKGPSEVSTYHVTIVPGGHTPWHHHPGPHLVQVKTGTLRVYQQDCTFKTFTAGQGLYDPGHTDMPFVHTAHNAEAAGDVVIAVTDVRETDKRSLVVAEPQPKACFTSTAGGVGALGLTRVDDAKSTFTDLITVRTAAASEVTTGGITIAPGARTPWHHHPGPHIVTVKTGTVQVQASDCTVRTFSAGQGFYDPGRTDVPFVHAAVNNEPSGNVEVLVTDVRETDKRLTVMTEPQPAACPTATVPAPAATPIVSDTLPRTS